MIIQITGDREWNPTPGILVVHNALQGLLQEFDKTPAEFTVVHGYCRGADMTAGVCAEQLGMNVICCPAHWRHNSPDWVKFHGPCPVGCTEVVGKAAGVIRNGYMLDTYDADIVLAFHDHLADSTGTLDMVRRCRKKGKEVRLFTYDGYLMTNPPVTKTALIKALEANRPQTAQERFLEF